MKVRRKLYSSGKLKWEADLGRVNGKRVQTYHATREKAEAAVAAAKAKLRQHGHESLAMTEDERVRLAGARDRLAGAGATIEQAVDFFLAHHKPLKERVTVAKLAADCLAEKELEGKRRRYLDQLACSWRSFTRGREDLSATEVGRDLVKTWLRGNAWAPKTQQVYLGDLRTLFAWGIKERYVAENPCAGVEPAAAEPEEIAAMTARQAERLLRAALYSVDMESRLPFSDLLGYAVIGLFCGIRPEELQRSTTDVIDLDHSTVIVTGRRAKTRQRRVADLSPNAVAWLRAWLSLHPSATRIIPRNFKRRWKRLREACCWLCNRRASVSPAAWRRPWPHDVMRHTFASMHYAMYQNEHLLQTQLGHESANVLFTNYRALKTRAEAEAFWALRPKWVRLIRSVLSA